MAAIQARTPDIQLPRTNTGKFKMDADTLAELTQYDPFLKTLLEYKTVTKLQSTFLDKMAVPVLHPKFDVLKTTGRTSSYGDINAQNLPRDDRIRSCFIPSPGHVFIAADYAMIELVALSQACQSQFGWPSQMAEAINAGKDLHKLVAGQVTGKDPDAVSPEERQQAKAINFGKPGGMGNAAMKSYAKANYGIDWTDEQVEQQTQAWSAMFPEMSGFLNDANNTGMTVATYFGLTPNDYATHTSGSRWWNDTGDPCFLDTPHGALGGMCLKALKEPSPVTGNGRPYSPEEIAYFWDRLTSRAGEFPTALQKVIASRKPSAKLSKDVSNHLCRDGVYTLTGRLRAKATYCARHNTVFQGLAADGAKLGLWLLWRAGYRIVNFIHDEVLVEVPENSNLKEHAEEIGRLMREGMRMVVPDFRVSVEYAATRRWYKKAKAKWHPQTGELLLWEPDHKESAGTVKYPQCPNEPTAIDCTMGSLISL
jgi:hypothetical protein